MKKWDEALRKALKMYILLPEKRRQCTTKGYTPEKVRLSCLVYLFRHSQTMSLENLTFQTDYKGEIKLCKRYSKNKIKDIFAKVVRQGDFFMEEVDGGKQNVKYRPKPFSNEQMIGVFAIVVFEDGSMMYDTMSSEDIENVRNTYSKAKDSQAWKSSTGEMYKKTVLRRLCKLIDLDFDNIEQQKAYEDGGDAVFNQQSLPGATTGQALLPENDKPVDAFAAMKAQKQAEPVIDGMVLEEA